MGNSAPVLEIIAGTGFSSKILLQSKRYCLHFSKELISPFLTSTDTAVLYSPILIFFKRFTSSLDGPISIKWVLPDSYTFSIDFINSTGDIICLANRSFTSSRLSGYGFAVVLEIIFPNLVSLKVMVSRYALRFSEASLSIGV